MIEKRGVILALALLLVILISFSASGALVYNNWILPNETITVNSNKFIFSLSRSQDRLYVSGNGTTMILSMYDCKEGSYYFICFNGTRFNLSKDWGYVDPVTDEMVPQLLIKINDKVPSLTITREIGNYTLMLNEETTISVVIRNDGTTDLYDVTYTDTLPVQLLIFDYNKLTRTDNTLTWSGTIREDQNKTFDYTVRMIGEVDFNSTANVSYKYVNTTWTKETPIINIKSLNPLTAVIGFSDDNLSIYDNTTLNFKFTSNDGDYYVNITAFEVIFPENLLIASYTDNMTRVKSGQYRWTKDLAAEKSDEVEFNISCNRYDKFTITYEYTYKSHGFTKNVSGELNLSFDFLKLEPTFSIPGILRA